MFGRYSKFKQWQIFLPHGNKNPEHGCIGVREVENMNLYAAVVDMVIAAFSFCESEKVIVIMDIICYSWHIQTIGKCHWRIGADMTISERLFEVMKQQNISMPELSRMTGISRHTIFDWQRRGTNPGADKIMIICEVLNITPEQLLIGKAGEASIHEGYKPDEIDVKIMEASRVLSEGQKKRLLAYVIMLQNMKEQNSREGTE